MDALSWFIRLMLATVLVGAALGKLQAAARAELATALGQAGLVSRRLETTVANGLLAAEAVAAGLLLAAPLTGHVVGPVAAALLFAALTAGVISIVAGKRTVACRCFGGGTSRLGPRHVARNASLLALAVTGLVIAAQSPPANPEPAWAVLGAGLGLVTGATLVAWHDITYLLSAARPLPVSGGIS